MEARESNEHIDLMQLIVMQLISTLAPVTKMKGLQQSEINWVELFCLSPVRVWTCIRGVWQTGHLQGFLFVSLHLSAFIPTPIGILLSSLFQKRKHIQGRLCESKSDLWRRETRQSETCSMSCC